MTSRVRVHDTEPNSISTTTTPWSKGSRKKSIETPTPIPVLLLLLEFYKGSHGNARVFVFFPSLLPPHALVGFSQRIQSFKKYIIVCSCHLFLARGTQSSCWEPEQSSWSKISHSPISLPAQLKKKEWNKGISCAFRENFLCRLR